MNEPLVSIIIPTYNRANFLKETLNSLTFQTYKPLEIVIIDDGSTDNTEEIIAQYSPPIGNSKKYIKQKNQGPNAARNAGLNEASGHFIQFLDSDDLMSDTKIEKQIEQINKDYNVGAYGPWRVIYSSSGEKKRGPPCGESGKTESFMLEGYLTGSWFSPIHSYLFPKNFLEAVGGFDVNLSCGDDADLLVRILLSGFNFKFVPNSNVFYRRHNGGHLGDENNFKKGLTSNLNAIGKWFNILKQKNRQKFFILKIDQRLLVHFNDAYCAGFYQGCESVYDFRKKISEILEIPLPEITLFHKGKLLLKRYIKKLFYLIFSEYHLEWIKFYINFKKKKVFGQ